MTKAAPIRDVFISYSSRDRAVVLPMVKAIDRAGMSYWFDQNDLRPFDAKLSGRIADGIRSSRLTLAFLSADYEASSACQWELIQTLSTGGMQSLLLAASRPYSPRSALLAENVHLGVPFEDSDPTGVIVALRRCLTDLPPRRDADSPSQWWPDDWQGATFGGRFRERIALFSAFNPHLGHPGSSTTAFDRAQIVGMGGQGKSMLALQHGLDAARQYRCVARFDVGGDRFGGVVSDPEPVMDGLLGQIHAWASDEANALDLTMQLPNRRAPGAWRDTSRAVKTLVRHLDGQVLWIMDDVPAGLPAEYLQRLFCPGSGKTLLTTRTSVYTDLIPSGATIHLPEMTLIEAVYLLARGDSDTIADQGSVLEAIATEVGRHALTLAVLARRISAWSAERVLEALRSQPAVTISELERVARRIGDMPTGHRASIVATLRMSIDSLAEPASWSILQLASVWPPARPIPLDLLATLFGEDSVEGAQELIEASLAQKSGDDDLTVHTLVSGVTAWLIDHTASSSSDSPRGPAAGPDTTPTLRRAAARWLRQQTDTEDVWRAADLGETAWYLLEPIRTDLDDDDRRIAAESLMAMARLPMRHKPGELSGVDLVDYLDKPIGWAQTAGRLRQGTARGNLLGVGRAQAMEGLLRMDQASAEPAADRQILLAESARDLLERSIATRLPLIDGSDDPDDRDEVIRAYFNFGRLIALAQALASREAGQAVEETLDAAAEAYRKARDARQEWLDETPAADTPAPLHENLAACHRGLAIVTYTRAVYQPGCSAEQRNALLVEIGDHLAQSRSLTTLARDARVRAAVANPGTVEGVATPDMTKDLQVQAKRELAHYALATLTLPDGLAQVIGVLDLLAGMTPTEATELVGDQVPWGPIDPTDPDCGESDCPPGWFALARLRVHQSRGGKGMTADRVLAEFRHKDLPALTRSLDTARLRP